MRRSIARRRSTARQAKGAEKQTLRPTFHHASQTSPVAVGESVHAHYTADCAASSAQRGARCRRKLCGRGDIQTTLEYYGFSTSLYQFRLNVRYTTGRSASLLLAPVVGRSKGPRAAWPGHRRPSSSTEYRIGRGWPGGAWAAPRCQRTPQLQDLQLLLRLLLSQLPLLQLLRPILLLRSQRR